MVKNTVRIVGLVVAGLLSINTAAMKRTMESISMEGVSEDQELQEETSISLVDSIKNRVWPRSFLKADTGALDLHSLNLNSLAIITHPIAQQRIFSLINCHLIALDLHNNKLAEIAELSMLNLVRLNLAHNQISKLPAELASLTHLHELNLSHNLLTDLPKELASLNCLVDLYVSGNKLSTLPNELRSLQCLQMLVLDNNRLLLIPLAVRSMPSLITVILAYNKIKLKADDFTKMKAKKSLTYLDISHNDLHDIPKTLDVLRCLNRLIINDNKLTRLPTTMDNLKELQVMQAENNDLTSIPSEIATLPLLILNLNNNKLQSLPEAITKLKSLVYLGIMHNTFGSNNQGVAYDKLTSLFASISGQKESLAPQRTALFCWLLSLHVKDVLYVGNFFKTLPWIDLIADLKNIIIPSSSEIHVESFLDDTDLFLY